MLAEPLHLWASLSAPACIGYALSKSDKLAMKFGAQSLSQATTAGVWLICSMLLCLAAYTAPDAAHALARLCFGSVLVHVALVDARIRLVPIRACVALALGGVAYALMMGDWRGAASALAAGAVFFAMFLLLTNVYRHLRGRDGLGEGDAYVAMALGAALGLERAAFAVAVGAIVTGIYAIAVRGPMRAAPLAPGLAFGAAIVSLFS